MGDFTVMLTSDGGLQVEMFDFDFESEARQFCEDNDWILTDDNGFCWNMFIRDNRHS